jgi:cytochrome c-type biogenesis protein CcmH
VAIPAAADSTADYRKAIRTIRCDCGCHPQTVEACACGRAAEMRETMAAMVEGTGSQGGMSADAVIAYYVAEQGEQILISPPATGFNLLAWLGPLIGLVLGLFAAVTLVRHLARKAGQTNAGLPAGTGPVDRNDPYRDKLRRQLEELD